MASDLYLGVSVSARVLYLGVVRAPDEFLLDDAAERIEPSAQLELDGRLGDVRDRLRDELRRLKPSRVGVTKTKKYSNWKFADAFDRVSLETAVILACVDEGIPCRIVRSEDAAKAVPAAVTKVEEQAADRWGVEPSKYWKHRVWAFATALAMAKGIS
jgi:hypothetical protein